MKITALALALSFGLVSSMAAFAQTAAPATPAAPAKPAVQAQTKPVAKLDCTKVENKTKDECKVVKKTDKKS